MKPEEVSEYGRPMSKHMDKELLTAMIRETEDQDIKPVIGDHFYAFLLDHMEEEPTTLFLNGGRWNEVDDPTFDESFEEEPDCNHIRYFCGLKAAMAYYVQAKLIKANDGQITRFGLVEKDEQYSNKTSDKSKNSLYNDYAHIADNYLNECRQWMNEHSYYFPAYTLFSQGLTANRTTYKVIGE